MKMNLLLNLMKNLGKEEFNPKISREAKAKGVEQEGQVCVPQESSGHTDSPEGSFREP